MSTIQVSHSLNERIAQIENYLINDNLNAAEKECVELLQTNPKDFNLFYYLTFIANKRGQAAEAFRYAFKAFDIIKTAKPDTHLPYLQNIGTFLSQNHYFDAAIECFRIALIQDAENYHSLYNLGITYGELNDYPNALKYLLMAEKIETTTQVLNGIGIALCALQRIEEGIEYFNKAITLTPNDYNAYYNIGTSLQNKGLTKEASDYLYKAIEIDPNNYLAYYILTDCIKFKEGNKSHKEIINKINDFLTNQTLERKYVYKLNFALGKIYQDLGDYNKAFQHFLIANQHKSLETPFNIDEYRNILHRNKTTFTADLFKKKRIYGNKTTIPIFIVGMPRSGTTLTEQIIASHSKIYGLGETKYIDNIIKSIPARKLAGHISPLTAYPEIIPYLSGDNITAFSNAYLKRTKQHSSNINVKTVDKLPDNFSRLGFINLIFPNATIIHCKRHPLDVFISIFFEEFDELDFANDPSSLVGFYNYYTDIMKHWHTQFPGKIHDSYYEELVYKQEEKSRELIKACGLKWEEQCLNFHKNDRAIFTASKLQVKEPMYSSSVFRFKNYEKHLAPVKEALKDEIAEYEADIIRRVPELAGKLRN